MDGLPIKYDVEGLLDLDLWLENLDFTCARWIIGCNSRWLSDNDIKLMTECPFTVGKFEIYTNNMIVLDDGGWCDSDTQGHLENGCDGIGVMWTNI